MRTKGRCACGERISNGLPQCSGCFLREQRRISRDEGISYGCALAELRTHERLHREGRLCGSLAPTAANGIPADRTELRLLLQVVHPDRNPHPKAARATQIVLRMLDHAMNAAFTDRFSDARRDLGLIQTIIDNSPLSEVAINSVRLRLAGISAPFGSDGESAVGKIVPFRATLLNDMPLTARPTVVQRWIESASVTAIFGVPNGGKTHLPLTSPSTSANKMWFGVKVDGGPVVYVAAEAPGSVVMRARAAHARKFPGPVDVVTDPPLLGDDAGSAVDADRLIAMLHVVAAAEGKPVKMLVIDTPASRLGDGDENTDGMLRVVFAAKRIAVETGVAVVVVHHPTKSTTAGMRGHGSLAAACDNIIEITADELTGQRTATLVKSRDSATGMKPGYELETVTLPDRDHFGDARFTIIVSGRCAAVIVEGRPHLMANTSKL